MTSIAKVQALRLALALPVFALPATAALAHHGIDGRTPETFQEGLISGLAHPIVGLDHLVFILAAGLASGALGLRLRVPALFVVFSIAGLWVHFSGVTLPLPETAVGASIVLLGIAAASRGELGAKLWMALFIGAGFFHGYAYGESIVGAGAVPLIGYLSGLAIVQGGLISATHLAGRQLAEGVGHARPEMRHIGALLAVIGAFFFVVALSQGA